MPNVDLRKMLEQLELDANKTERRWHTIRDEAFALRHIDSETQRGLQLAAGELEMAVGGLRGAVRALSALI